MPQLIRLLPVAGKVAVLELDPGLPASRNEPDLDLALPLGRLGGAIRADIKAQNEPVTVLDDPHFTPIKFRAVMQGLVPASTFSGLDCRGCEIGLAPSEAIGHQRPIESTKRRKHSSAGTEVSMPSLMGSISFTLMGLLLCCSPSFQVSDQQRRHAGPPVNTRRVAP